MNKSMITEKERVAWANSFEASKRWLTDVAVKKSGSKHTETEYATTLYIFCQRIGKNPDQLINERKAELKNEDNAHNAEDQVNDFCSNLQTERKLQKTTVTKYLAELISFYKYNYCSLRIAVPRRQGHERLPHTVEELKTLMQVADLREKTMILVIKDSGMSREDVVKLTYGDIKNEFEAGENFIHLRVTREKESLEYDTFLGKNAVESIKAYLENRKRAGEQLTPKSPLLATIHREPLSDQGLSMIFDRLSDKVGFKTSPHRLRKYFESHLGLVAPSILVKKWMGHSLGVEKSYFIPPLEKQKQHYIESYREIDIEKREPTDALEVEKLIFYERLRASGVSEDKISQLQNKLAKATREDFNGFRDDVSKKGIENITAYIVPKKDKECKDGKNCQKIIEEQELSSYIEQGWKFVSVLPSGKIVVSND